MTQHQDKAVRAITNDGAFRIMTVDTTETVRGILKAQKVTGSHQRKLFSELITAAVLIRETMSPGQRVQAILKPTSTVEGGVALIADAQPEGLTRGLLSGRQEEEEEPLTLSSDTLLQVIRVMHNNELNQGFVLTDAATGVSGAITEYMMSSEQVMSTVEVTALLDNEGNVVSSAGFIVQLLPEAEVESLEAMTARLEARNSLETILKQRSEFDPVTLMQDLMGDFEHTVLAEDPVYWGCTCSEVRLVSAMATLGREELSSIVEEGGFLDVACEYCGTNYRIGTEQMKALLSQS